MYKTHPCIICMYSVNTHMYSVLLENVPGRKIISSEKKYRTTFGAWKYFGWHNKKQKMVLGDITNLDDLIQAIEGCEYVYNFAGISDLNQALFKHIENLLQIFNMYRTTSVIM